MSAVPRSKSNHAMESLIRHHPTQRLSSPSRSISLLVHSAGLASSAYSFEYLVAHPNHINTAYGWHFQYLTIIGLALATLTFILGSLADLTLSPRLFVVKNALSMCSAPMEVLISFLYWGLRAIDPALVIPKELELPLLADLSFHLMPSLLLVIDLLFFSPPWAINILPAIALSGVIAFVYWFWIELCYSYNGFYPYPIFEMLDKTQRTLLFAGSAVVMAANTLVLKWVYVRINGVGKERPGKSKIFPEPSLRP